MATKTYPDTTFEKIARKAGASVTLLWEMRGPKDTSVAWMTCYLVNGMPAIVQTYGEGNGWNVFTPGPHLDIEGTLADALNRCKVPAPAKKSAA